MRCSTASNSSWNVTDPDLRISPSAPFFSFLISLMSCCVRSRDEAERPVLMRSMSMRPVRGSVAAANVAECSSRCKRGGGQGPRLRGGGAYAPPTIGGSCVRNCVAHKSNYSCTRETIQFAALLIAALGTV